MRAAVSLSVLCLVAVSLSAFAGYPPQGPGGTVVSLPYSLAVAKGSVPGTSHINKFGHNDDIDTGTVPETVWSRGALWVPPTASRTHQIKSTSGDDTNSSGSGARTLRIYGLDSAWAEQTEDINLNGITDVPTASTYTRIFRMVILTAGSSEMNAGTITATADTDSTVTAEIDIGAGITHMAVWTVPAGHTLYASGAFASLNRQGATGGAFVEFEFCVVSGLDTAVPAAMIVQTFALAVDGTSAVNYMWETPKVVPGPADVFIRVNYVSDSNSVVSAGFSGVYAAN